MYKVIGNEKELRTWLENDENKVKDFFLQKDINEHLYNIVETLDKNYGSQRDLEKNLGGYVIVIFGNETEVEEQMERVLKYHHLEKNDKEFQDDFIDIRSGKKISFWLFLCSSDYSIEIITVL